MQADLLRRSLRGCHEVLQAGIVGGDVLRFQGCELLHEGAPGVDGQLEPVTFRRPRPQRQGPVLVRLLHLALTGRTAGCLEGGHRPRRLLRGCREVLQLLRGCREVLQRATGNGDVRRLRRSERQWQVRAANSPTLERIMPYPGLRVGWW